MKTQHIPKAQQQGPKCGHNGVKLQPGQPTLKQPASHTERASAQHVVVPSIDTLEQLDVRNCNKSQAAAVLAATSQNLTLIHGPPGTGKVY